MKIIDDAIRDAIHKVKLCVGTNEDVGKKLGMTGKHVGSILSGKTIYCGDITWKKIEPILKPYIKNAESNAEFVRLDTKDKLFPVISDAAAAGCNTSYIPLAEYARENSEEMRFFDLGKSGDVVIRVAGESMLPWYPPGTLVLVRPNKRPHTGQRVVAVLEDGDVVFKIFGETKKHFHLLSLNSHDGKDFHFKKDDYHSIRSIWIVIQSARNELELDKAMQNAGIHHEWENKLQKFKE
jgi:SOS-response transcriptional repressor LexA